MKNKDFTLQTPHTKIDTLVVVGNGFDVWQGLPTTFGSFRNFYFSHREEILKKLRLPLFDVVFDDGTIEYVSDVELVYGNPFSPRNLDDHFWGNFEYSLSDVDDQCLNLFFGKTRKGLRALKRSVGNAKKILSTAFSLWAKSIEVSASPTTKVFGENCLFINFNYTDTLQKRFNIPPTKIFHPHGSIADGDDLIFGHSSHPETPSKDLYRFGGRFRGLYFVECLLRMTDKNVLDHVQELRFFFALNCVRAEDIKEVYVLGHAINPVDLLYFDFLAETTTVNRPTEPSSRDEELDIISQIRQAEQEAKDKASERYFYKLLGIKQGLLQAPKSERTNDAQWHVTCFSQMDKKWIPTAISKLGVSNVKFYDDIPSCIKSLKK